MKKIAFVGALLFSFSLLAQNDLKDLKNDIDNIKSSIKNLQTEIQSVKSENIYLKKVFNINRSILEQEKANTQFSITKVEGNKSERTIYITFLQESKDKERKTDFDKISIIDIEGNEIGLDFLKSTENLVSNLATNIPKKMLFAFTYKDFEHNLPNIIKLLRFRFRYKNDEKELFDEMENVEFRDLNVVWK